MNRLAWLLLLAPLGCNEMEEALNSATPAICEAAIAACSVSIVADYQYCSDAVDDPWASALELQEKCQLFYRGEQCGCIPRHCAVDTVGHPELYSPWAVEFVDGLNCPSHALQIGGVK
jgi:hypothetical protein